MAALYSTGLWQRCHVAAERSQSELGGGAVVESLRQSTSQNQATVSTGGVIFTV